MVSVDKIRHIPRSIRWRINDKYFVGIKMSQIFQNFIAIN